MLLQPILPSDTEGTKWVKLQSWLRLAVDNAGISYSMSGYLQDISPGDVEGLKWAKLGAWMELLAQNISGGGGGGGITQLTGDVTAGPGSGSQAATVANGAVTNAKLADMANGTIKGRTTAGSGDPEDMTEAQANAILQGTGLSSTASGFRGIPQNSQSAAYTTVAADSGKHLLHPTADDNPRTFTIAANGSVAYPVGTAITFVNQINVLTIAINSDTLVWAQDGSTGSRTLAANGIATAVKLASAVWLISGVGLS